MLRMTAATALRLNAAPARAPRASNPLSSLLTAVEFSDEAEDMDVILQDVFERGGFGAVVRLCADAQKRLAENNRAEVDAQGWMV